MQRGARSGRRHARILPGILPGTLPDILPRILRAEAGSVAVEFASAVVPLLAFVFAILQVALYHFALQSLDAATRSASREIMLGRAHAKAPTVDQFRTALLCPALQMPLDCAKVTVSVTPVPKISPNAPAPAITAFLKPEIPALLPVNLDPLKSTYCLGAPGDFLFIDVAYSYAPLGTLLQQIFGGAIRDAMILRSTNFIYAEPPQGSSANAPSGC